MLREPALVCWGNESFRRLGKAKHRAKGALTGN